LTFFKNIGCESSFHLNKNIDKIIYICKQIKSSMASKILKDIKSEISKLESQIRTLVDAANLIAEASQGRGRKTKISSSVDSLINQLGKKGKLSSGRRGRPVGSKNKPGAKKPGPKSSSKAIAAPAPKKAAGKKRGRPSKKATSVAN
jgi:hypothetical protein